MAVGFTAGAETLTDLISLVRFAKELDGLKEIQPMPGQALEVMLCFETDEQAQTAQWMLEMAGSEGREST